MFSLAHLDRLRRAEIDALAADLPRPGARILEIGAGTGGRPPSSRGPATPSRRSRSRNLNYAQERLFPLTDYDGRQIPFPDASFDVVFSSNVLEHVPDLPQIHREIRRVLRPDGFCLHVLPTASWRLWTSLSAFPAALQHVGALGRELGPHGAPTAAELRRLARVWRRAARHLGAPLVQRRHGERGSALSELWLFRPRWWRRNFRDNGFEVASERPMGLFYTGHMVFGARWPLERRARLARALGSACHLFRLTVRS